MLLQEHLLQFAERCMLHIVDRSQDTSTAVACKAIQMLRLPVLAERMTDTCTWHESSNAVSWLTAPYNVYEDLRSWSLKSGSQYCERGKTSWMLAEAQVLPGKVEV